MDHDLHDRRRGEILAAAGRHFAEHGYAGADTQQLADALGVAKGTVFRYFPTKRTLFEACLAAALAELTAATDTAAASVDDPLDKLCRAMRAYLAYFDDHPQVVELLILERAEFKHRTSSFFDHRDRPGSEREWRGVLAGLVAAKRLRPLPVARILDFLGDLLFGTIFSHHMSGRRRPLRARYPALLDAVLHALLTDAERRRLTARPGNPVTRPSPRCSPGGDRRVPRERRSRDRAAAIAEAGRPQAARRRRAAAATR